jgi:hypothetical protein
MSGNGLWLAVFLFAAWRSQAQSAASVLAANLLSAPVVQVVASPAGANVRGTGTGLGSLDFGHVSWAKAPQTGGVTQTKDKASFTLATKIGLRLACSAADGGRLANVSAFLQQADSTYTVLLDGVRMSLSPTVVIPAAACGSTTQHLLEVLVPITAPSGPINPSLGFGVVLR